MKKVKPILFITGVVMALIALLGGYGLLFRYGCGLLAVMSMVKIYDLCLDYTNNESTDPKYYNNELIKITGVILLTIVFLLLPFKVIL